MSFYVKKVDFDPKVDSISKKSLTTLRSQKWSEENITMFVQYRVEFENKYGPLEFDLDDKFEEMWWIEHPSDVSSNDSLESFDRGEEQWWPKAAQAFGRIEQVAGEAREATSKTSQELVKKQGKVYTTKRKALKALQSPKKREEASLLQIHFLLSLLSLFLLLVMLW